MSKPQLFAYSLIIAATASSGLPLSANETSSEGIRAFRMGDYQRAEQLYRQALSEETDSAQQAAIYRNLSILYNAQGKDGSEFSKKADQLNPAEKPAYTQGKFQASKSNQFSDQFYGALPFSGSLLNSASPINSRMGAPAPAASSPGEQDSESRSANAASPNIPTDQGGIGFSGSFSRNTVNCRLGGMYNGATSNFGGALNSRMNPSGGILRGPGLGSVYGGGYYSPGNVFEYSNATPMVLPAGNGAVILNAPGPNIYSSRQAPDGSSTTIIMRTE